MPAFEASNGMEANTLPGNNDAIVEHLVGAHSGNLRKNSVMRVERDALRSDRPNGGGSEDRGHTTSGRIRWLTKTVLATLFSARSIR